MQVKKAKVQVNPATRVKDHGLPQVKAAKCTAKVAKVVHRQAIRKPMAAQTAAHPGPFLE